MQERKSKRFTVYKNLGKYAHTATVHKGRAAKSAHKRHCTTETTQTVTSPGAVAVATNRRPRSPWKRVHVDWKHFQCFRVASRLCQRDKETFLPGSYLTHVAFMKVVVYILVSITRKERNSKHAKLDAFASYYEITCLPRGEEV